MEIKINSDRIDWEQLRHQKMAALEIREQLSYQYEIALTGIVHLLDYIQDLAVEHGMSENEVFGDYEVDRKSRLEVLER